MISDSFRGIGRIGAAMGVLALSVSFFSGAASGDVIVSVDFDGRTVSGLTASDLTWTTNGVADPGDITVVENETNGQNDGTTENGGLFDTSSAADALALDLNVNNEDGWYFDVPLAFIGDTLSLDVTTLDLAMENFNNSGATQTVGRPTLHRAELIGSVSGVVATDSASYNGTVYSDTFDLTANLGGGEDWTLRIYADFNSGSGNNTGYQSLALNGTVNVVPEPMSLAVSLLGAMMVSARRRR